MIKKLNPALLKICTNLNKEQENKSRNYSVGFRGGKGAPESSFRANRHELMFVFIRNGLFLFIFPLKL